MEIETILALALGVSLSAACGFRVFVPPLVLSISALYGDLHLAPEFAWVGTYPALLVLTAATIVEILAYFIPVVDNFLDVLEVPLAIVVGTLVTAATLEDVEPVIKWSIAAIAGGGSAGLIDLATTLTRLVTTGVTGGLGNMAVATTEILSAIVLCLLALLVPFLSAFLVIMLLGLALNQIFVYIKKIRKRKSSKDYHHSG